MRKPISKKDILEFLTLIVILVLSAIYSKGNFKRAFPEASLHFNLKRKAAIKKAEGLAKALSFPLEGYKKGAFLNEDGTAKIYIDRELGLDTLNVLLKKDVKIWYWSVRFFKPGEKLQFYAGYNPETGNLVGFFVDLPEDSMIPTIPQDSAYTMATEFLKSVGYDPSILKLVKAKSEKLKSRTDYFFEFEDTIFTVKEARKRIDVKVSGNTISLFKTYLKVPETWLKEYRKTRSGNNLLQTIDTFLVVLFIFIPGFFFAFKALKERKKESIKSSIYLATITALAFFIVTINSSPASFVMQYSTLDSPLTFHIKLILLGLLQGILMGAFVFMFFMAGTFTYPTLKGKLKLSSFFKRRTWETEEFLKSILAGFTLVAFDMALVIAYYILGKKIGFWSPPDVLYDNRVMLSYIPFLMPLMAVIPAFFEEGMARFFPIQFYRKKLGLVGALIIPAALWAFLHSSYPQMPFYVRGIEVTLMGIIAGIAMLKYGILATIVWHYTYDAFLMSYVVFTSFPVAIKILNALVVFVFAIPFIMGLLGVIRNKGFLLDEELLYSKEENVAPKEKEADFVISEPQKANPPYYKLAPLAILLLLLGLVFKAPLPGTIKKIENPLKVKEKLLEITQNKKLPLKNVFTTKNIVKERSIEAYYIYTQKGISGLKDYIKSMPLNFYYMRFFEPQKIEEYRLFTELSGNLYSESIVLPETAYMPSVSKDSAYDIAIGYLKKKGFSPANLITISSEEKKLKNRTDHHFVFEDTTRAIKDARYRIKLSIVGNRVSGFKEFYHIPEKFIRKHNKGTLISTLYMIMRVLFFVVVIFVLAVFFRKFKMKALKISLSLLIPALVLLILGVPFSLERQIANYDTSIPFSSFITQSIAGILTGIIFAWGFSVFLWAFMFSLDDLHKFKKDGNFVVNSILGGFLTYSLFMGTRSIIYRLLLALHLPVHDLITVRNMFLTGPLQFFTLSTNTVLMLLIFTPVIVLYFYGIKHFTIPLKVILVILLGSVLFSPTPHTLKEFIPVFLASLLIALSLVIGERLFIRDNIFAFATAVLLYFIPFNDIMVLFKMGGVYILNAILSTIIPCLIVLYIFLSGKNYAKAGNSQRGRT